MKFFGSLFQRLEPHSRRERLVLVAAVLFALLLLLVDQGSKLWVEHVFEHHESCAVIEGWLDIFSVRNTGAAWSILRNQIWLLLLIAIIAFSAILYFFHHLTERYPERYFAIFMVLSGIVGNSIDRLWRGAVVDFIHVHYYDKWDYPVFNVADIAICVGVGIFVLSCFIRPEKKPDAENRKRGFFRRLFGFGGKSDAPSEK
ncbi:MAG: signal peptidase II [Lentisphaeria bacterium]|jgi:signal peptidase II|nr:signal peptidase II [Lentisphaeria bacterium]